MGARDFGEMRVPVGPQVICGAVISPKGVKISRGVCSRGAR